MKTRSLKRKTPKTRKRSLDLKLLELIAILPPELRTKLLGQFGGGKYLDYYNNNNVGKIWYIYYLILDFLYPDDDPSTDPLLQPLRNNEYFNVAEFLTTGDAYYAPQNASH